MSTRPAAPLRRLERCSLRTKLTLTVLGLVGMVSVLLMFVVTSRLDIIEKRAVEWRAATLAEMLAQPAVVGLEFDDDEHVLETLKHFESAPDARYAQVRTADGRLAATLDPDTPSHNWASAASDHTVTEYAEDTLHVRTPIVGPDGTVLGDLALGLSLEGLEARRSSNLRAAATISLAAFVIGAIGSLLLGGLLVRPLERVTASAIDIAHGRRDLRSLAADRDPQALADARDEATRMTGAVGLMAETLADQVDEIERQRQRADELAGTLAEKAELLEDSNAQLEEAMQRQQEAQQELVDLSRHAGMAEVAIGVLHNIGNVLNSVNVAASVADDALRQSRLPGLDRLAGMLGDQGDQLPQFYATDPRAARVPMFLDTMARHLAREHRTVREELATVLGGIEHIKTIVSTQQANARGGGLVEPISVAELVEDAITLAAAASTKARDVEILREVQPLPVVMLDRHRVLMTLVNLIRNGLQALAQADQGHKKLILGAHAEGSMLLWTVSDNGIGIEPDVLPRLFEHGFTTRAEGHGFGLHNAATAARSMQGSLTAHSEGAGTGATFTLSVPLQAYADAETTTASNRHVEAEKAAG